MSRADHYKEVVIATRNQKKKAEILRLLGNLGAKALSLSDYPQMPQVVEDGTSFDENAIKKATETAEYTGKLTLADDSGLEVEALGGEPGVRSSRFAGEDADDKKNNEKLLSLLKGVPLEKRKAQFRCSVAIATPEGNVKLVRGSCRGLIGFQMKGKTGFGYDSVFVMPRYERTFAELGPRIKDKMSHRSRALKQARRVLLRYINRDSNHLNRGSYHL